MANLTQSLDLEKSSDDFLSDASSKDASILNCFNDLTRKIMARVINGAMVNEMMGFMQDAMLSGEDSPNYRNGYYARNIQTPIGEITLSIPRDRLGLFKTKLVGRYQRRSQDLSSIIMSLYGRGMTARELKEVLEAQYGLDLSLSTIEKIACGLMDDASEFNGRKLPDCPIIFLDGTWIPLKRFYQGNKSRFDNECVFVALGIRKDGRKEVLGFWIKPAEGANNWASILEELKKRGVASPKLFVTDGLNGMTEAIKSVYPLAKHQSCLVHVGRNIAQNVRTKDRNKVMDDFKSVYDANKTLQQCQDALNEFCNKWGGTYKYINEDVRFHKDLLTYFDFPAAIRKSIYTSNIIEGFNSQLKVKTKKRICFNSDDNAVISIVQVCKNYNNSRMTRKISGFDDLTPEERKQVGFDM